MTSPQLFYLDEYGSLMKTKDYPAIRDAAHALELSIAKWQFIVDALKDGRFITTGCGISTCALCSSYYHQDCRSCPVKQATGKWFCIDTPYDDFNDSQSLADAEAELAFLKSLTVPEENRS